MWVASLGHLTSLPCQLSQWLPASCQSVRMLFPVQEPKYSTRGQGSQQTVQLAEEQCKSDLSATPTCNMLWPWKPRPRPSAFYRFICTATGTRRSNTIYRAYSMCEAEINFTILTNREFQLRVRSKLQIISHIYVTTCRLRPGPPDWLGTDLKID